MPDAADKLPIVDVVAAVTTATAHATRAHTQTHENILKLF